MSNREIERISKALGDPYRLRIIEEVGKEGEWLPCGVLGPKLNIAQSTVSHHLKQLLDADLLTVEKDGRYKRYRINHDIFKQYLQHFNVYAR